MFRDAPATGGTTKRSVLIIAGMRGNPCRERIEEVLSDVKGVKAVDVSLMRGRAIVMHTRDCDAGQLISAVERHGYRAEVVPPRQ